MKYKAVKNMLALKRVRMLLRVSSDMQVDPDGDLKNQRQTIKDYVEKQPDWVLDEKEYFEAGVSAYKNSVEDRTVIQEALQDAKNGEYDILIVYKDDRLGRQLFDTPMLIMQFKEYGVDVYTTKENRISPEKDDIPEQMMLLLRYANAEKSSLDTAMRVKDNAKQLARQGIYLGGYAPYGYKLEFSGEIAKTGRHKKHLVVMPERAEIVKIIFYLSYYKEYGSSKIARYLNEHEEYRNKAPNDIWKSGEITSILTNPIYKGRVAYNRQQSYMEFDGGRKKRKYTTTDKKDWVLSLEANEEIRIIDDELWEKVQEKRMLRGKKYTKRLEDTDITVISRNDGVLPLLDVLYCGYCGHKMTNGSKYNYWTIKGTGEKRASKTPIYRCQMAREGAVHKKPKQYRADAIEQIVFRSLAEYIEHLQQQEDVFSQIEQNQNEKKQEMLKQLEGEKKKLEQTRREIKTLIDNIPKALVGDGLFTSQQLSESLTNHQKIENDQTQNIEQLQKDIESISLSLEDWEKLYGSIPTWRDIFLGADAALKRTLVNRLIERIEIYGDKMIIHFRVNLSDFFLESRMTVNAGVPQ